MSQQLPNVGSRVPPHNFEAEQVLLGAILLNNGAHSAASEIVQAAHFADPLHGRLFDMLGRLIERGQVATPFTLKTFAETDDDLKRAGGSAYIAKLAAASVHGHDAAQFARTIRDCHVRRSIIAGCDEAMVRAYREDDEATAAEQVEQLEHRLYEIAEGSGSDGFKPFKNGLAQALKSAEAAHANNGGLVGVPSGLRSLDDLLGGFQRSHLIVLAARPGMGKTALATNIAFHAANLPETTVGFFSLEMSSEELSHRILAEQAGVPSDAIKRGKLTAAQMDRVIGVTSKIESLPLFSDDCGTLTVAGLRTRARRLKRTHGLNLIVVDYIQLMQSAGRQKENRVQEVSEITRGLKTVAKELDVPVIALSQLSRNVEGRTDKRPLLSDLRDSGSIEQDADVVAFIYREEYYRKLANQDASDVRGQAELIIAKQRHGPTGMVKLSFDGPTTRFSDWASP